MAHRLREHYDRESSGIQQEFAQHGDGPAIVRRQSDLIEAVVLELWKTFV